MYARDLAEHLHAVLSSPSSFDETLKRFEGLRGHGLLPRGRQNAVQRLTDFEIANAVLGYVPTSPGRAGHASLVLGNLRPVGGPMASFGGAATLQETIACMLSSETACEALVSLTLSVERNFASDEFYAMAIFDEEGQRRIVSYVSKMAITLLVEGAEKTYDHQRMRLLSGRQLTLGRDFFERLRREIVISRHADRPLKTDWREYESEEAHDAFQKSLGARPNSNFLNLGVETAVAWPKEPTRVEFGGHRFVLYPRTKEYSQSISIDLKTERLRAEEARTFLNRFLSLLSWCDDQYAVLTTGWSGNPFPASVPRSGKWGPQADQWLFFRTLPGDEETLQRLAYYREGLNALESGLVTFAVLSFYKVFEVRKRTKRGEINPTKTWIEDVFSTVEPMIPLDEINAFHADRGDIRVSDYIIENRRVAAAHASKEVPSDADSWHEIQRFYSAKEVIRALARHYLSTELNLSSSRFVD